MKYDERRARGNREGTKIWEKLWPYSKMFRQVSEKPNRTLDQNDKWHAMLDELARDSGYTPDEMKAIIKQSITNSWLLEMVVTKETAKGMPYTYTISSSDLKVDQMSLLIEYTQQMQLAQSKVMAESIFS